MFILGLVLLLLGLFFGIQILWVIGAILLVVGLFGNGFAHMSTPVDGRRRRYWY